MKIVQVVPRYAPAWAFGGGVRMFWLLARYLASAGHEVVAITADEVSQTQRATVRREELQPGIMVNRYPNPSPWLANRLGPIFFHPRGMRRAIFEAAQGADIVHVGERSRLQPIWAAEACRAAGTPFVWSPYGGFAPATGPRGFYRRRLLDGARSTVIPALSACVVQTSHEFTAAVGMGLPERSVHLIPLGIDWTEFSELPVRGSFRQRLGLGADDRLIVSLSRLHPAKGTDILIHAFSMLVTSEGGPHLAIVGWDDGLLPRLQAMTRSLGLGGRVHFVPPMYGQDRFAAYVDADIFALTPRYYEETSLAALEAAACGTPTVVTHQCEIPGLAESHGGRVVGLDAALISVALAQLLDNNRFRLDVGRASREFVRDNLTSNQVGLRHEQLFTVLAGAKGTSNEAARTGLSAR